MALSNPRQKKEENKSQKCKSKANMQKKKGNVRSTKEKAKVRKRRVCQEMSGKSSPQDILSGHTGTLKSRKTFLRMKKSKGDFCLKHLFQETFWQNSILKCRTRPSSTDWVLKLQWTITLIPKIVPTQARGKNTWKYFEIEEFTLLGHPFITLSILKSSLF